MLRCGGKGEVGGKADGPEMVIVKSERGKSDEN